MQARVR